MRNVGKIGGAGLALLFAGALTISPLQAQQGGDTGGGAFPGNAGAGDLVNIPATGSAQQPNQQPAQGALQESDFTSGGDFDFGSLIDQLTIPEIPQFENQRFQPFVGRSRERFEALGIRAHPRSNIEVAGSSNSGGGGGRAVTGAAGRGAQRGQGLQAGGATNNIIRRSLRTRLVPRIEVRTPVSAQQVSSRFQLRLGQSPLLENGADGIQVRVENSTAYLTGFVGSLEERARVERMARLEPGIYRIDNQIEVQPRTDRSFRPR